MIVTATAAQERTVGVAEGDWFTYGLDFSWNTTDSDSLFPPSEYGDWERINETEWIKVTVTDVSGTNVSFQYLTHYENGTEEIGDGYIDADTGDESNAALSIISANLGENDSIYTSGDYSMWMINETITRTYPDGARNTNHINMTYEFSWTINELHYYFYQSINLYWDKETGILVEDSFDFCNQTGDHMESWSVVSRVTDSSVWVIPEFPAGSLMLAISVIVTVIAISIERRLTKKQPNNN
ncbi:MAG TPA: hypothetical protein ENN36_04245 [Candidatus Bathyarchaeota archaeon]|nr:hypothetical protein [Candidatus Bathyarchaeota archaeon]